MYGIWSKNILSIAIIGLAGIHLSWAQYSNGWIDFEREYYKISLASDGAYRLFYEDLRRAGIPVGEIDPKTIQLFHRGKEQALLISSRLGDVLSPGDFIAFYGQKNDGANDKALYSSPIYQPHSYYNLYSDTSAYFLTWGTERGRRVPTLAATNTTNIPKEPYHYHVRREIYHDEYAEGNVTQRIFKSTQFDQGEGWTGSKICAGSEKCHNQIDYVLTDLYHPVSTPTSPQLEIALVGRSDGLHTAHIYVGASTDSLRLLTTRYFSGYTTSVVTASFLESDIGTGGRMVVRVKISGVEGNKTALSVSYIQATFPQRFDMENQSTKRFLLKEKPEGTSYIEIENAQPNLFIWDITEVYAVKQINMYRAGSAWGGIVPNTTHQRTLFAYYDFLKPMIQRVQFRPINPSDFNYVIISHSSLMKPAKGYSNPVQAYGAYRSSVVGGSYKPLIVTTDELYNQFNYGEVSSLAIYRFMEYMVRKGNPRYLLLIGKGLDIAYDPHRKDTSALNGLRDLVPSAGMPGSDMAFTAGLGEIPSVPAVATGRIPAGSPNQVAAYLKKIIETEASLPDDLWRKRILHLSGGIEKSELSTFREYLNTVGKIAQQPHYGAIVRTIGKREPNPVELINVSEEVNKGLNFITFFGHSSPTTIDIDIGFATDPVMGYNNAGKYPIFLINGCNAGAFFSRRTAFGEDWILAEGKGARGFIAHSSYGPVGMLEAYTRLFYEVAYTNPKFQGAGIGTIQQEVARQLLATHHRSVSTITQVQQMVLLGDPAVKLVAATQPDFETNDEAIFLDSFGGKPINALTDSFAIKIGVKNFGAIIRDKLEVGVRRTFEDNSTVFYDSAFSFLQSTDTLELVIKKRAGENSFGNNRFTVSLDFADKIPELNEENNEATLQLFIPLAGTKNLFPRQYAIVDERKVTLTWQNSDRRSAERDYYVEIDTTATFDSPFSTRHTVTGGVLVNFQTTLPERDSSAYYWRTRLATPGSNEKKDWTVNSFTYMAGGKEGWTQGHFPQYLGNEVANLVADSLTKEFRFEETAATISVTTFSTAQSSSPRPSFKINQVEYNLATQYQPCRNNTINFVAMDKTTLIPYAAIPFIFQDPRTCGREPQVINSFTSEEIETDRGDGLSAYIDNLSLGDQVVIFSIGNIDYSSWSSDVVTKLGELGIGADQITTLQAGDLVVIFGRKGASKNTASIKKLPFASIDKQPLKASKTLLGNKGSGHLSTPPIGPAQNWERFIPMLKNIEPADQFTFDIIGLDLAGNETTLFTAVSQAMNISSILASQYPLLKLRANMQDTINQTAPQLYRWVVHYTPVAEGILMYEEPALSVYALEGDTLQAAYTFANISNRAFPNTLQVELRTLNRASGQQEKKQLTITAPLPGDSTTFSVRTNTRGRAGWNDITVFVNPQIYPEQYYYNNIVELQNHLYVEREKIVPVIDLTIDGRYVLDGDFVSSNPIIDIKILDESLRMPKRDTSGVRILLQSPCADEKITCAFHVVNMSGDDIQWYPATPSSPFRILFRPRDLTSGQYVLQVEGEDGSGNRPSMPYKLRFAVSEESFINFLPPYPNPSSDRVFFGFTAVGESSPRFYHLQIITQEGKAIYNFTMGSDYLHVGLNRTMWNGEDLQSNMQKTGIYLYKQIVEWGNRRKTDVGRLLLLR